MSLPKLLVIGHGRHGKDTVCDILKEKYNFNFVSSSYFCSKYFIFDRLKDLYGYNSAVQCFEDRHNHRKEWYDLICDFCYEDPSELGKAIFQEYDIYC